MAVAFCVVITIKMIFVMEASKVFFILLFFASVLCNGDPPPPALVETCASTDSICLKRSMKKFLDNTYKGIPEMGVEQVDPLIIQSFDVVFDESIGSTYKHKNLNITGFKTHEVKELTVNTSSKHLSFTTEFNISATGDVDIDYTLKSKKYAGSLTTSGRVIGSVFYDYTKVKDAKGVEHFQLGPETITCKTVNTPHLEFSSQLVKLFEDDEDIKSLSDETQKKIAEQHLCKLATECYRNLVKNTRAVVAVAPAALFLKDY